MNPAWKTRGPDKQNLPTTEPCASGEGGGRARPRCWPSAFCVPVPVASTPQRG